MFWYQIGVYYNNANKADSAEIACPKELWGMFNVQTENITQSKYRFEKKFNLEADADFNRF